MKSWKRKVIAFSLASGLLITGTAITTICTTHAASNTKIVSPMHQSQQTTIKKIKHLADQGKTVNSEEFALQSKTKDIVKKWGEPDESSNPNEFFYDDRGVGFIAKNEKVVKIFSGDRCYDDITYKAVKQVLGKPAKETKKKGTGVFLTYKAGKNTLQFIFYFKNGSTEPTTLSELNVS
ncbi:DUF4309 domain-containing protein [Shimazuella kribbensis]|uniref:DUF4309 domain-containing protein n=1 Tax=Shimazuella kribbensis TaxID=139808 RepID=UPI000416FC61|nr:DUF4309 domain-containing protein [Shimazuella kribbensis]